VPGRWRRFARLPAADRLFLLRAACLQLAAALALRLRPLSTLTAALERRAERSRRAAAVPPSSAELDRWAELVSLADRHGLLPASCLQRALILGWIMSGRGMRPSIRISVAKQAQALQAHAWVETPAPSPRRYFADDEFVPLAPAVTSG
jgi:hypothetical protein